MAFRLLRIVSSPEMFQQRLSELKTDYLIPRDYKNKVIEDAFDKVRKITREEALAKVDKKTHNQKNKGRVVVPLDYNPRLPNQNMVLKKHHRAMLIKNSSLKNVFPSPPMAALRQGPNLRRLLCKARLNPMPSTRPTRASRTMPGWRKCAGNRKQCPACPYTLEPTNKVIGQVTGYCHTIKDNVTCQDKNIVYYWKCVKDNCPDYPNCEYVGKSRRSFQERMCEHRDYVKREVLTEPAGDHFNNTPGHTVAHLKGLVLEKVRSPDPFVLAVREHHLIQKLDTFRNGLNKEA